MREKKTLEAWIENHSAAKVLYDNLETNLKVMTNLNPQEVKMLMRLNMIMVRQFAQDCGLE